MGLLDTLLAKAEQTTAAAGRGLQDIFKGYTESPESGAGAVPGSAESLGNFLSNGTPAGEATSAVGQLTSKIPMLGEEGSKIPNFLTKLGEGIKSDVGKVVAPDAAKSLYGAAHTQNIQDALRRNGVDNYQQLGPAATSLYQNKILPELSANPKLVPLTNVVDSIVGEMKKMSPGLDTSEAKTAAHSVTTDLYNIARDSINNATPVPNQIDTPALFNMKQALNKTRAVTNFFNDHPLTNLTDMATVAGRNALSHVIGQLHPDIAQATKDYGLLQDSVGSLYKASQQGRGLSLNLPIKIAGQNVAFNTPSWLGGAVRDATGNTLQAAGKVADTPLGKVLGTGGLLAGGAGLAIGGEHLAKQFNQSNTSDASTQGGSEQQNESTINGQHTSTIAQERYNVNSDPIKSGQLINTQDFVKQDNDLTQQIAQSQSSGDVVTAIQLKGKQAQLENSYGQQKSLRDAWTDPVRGTGNILTVGNEAYKSIQAADPSFFNALNQGYDKLLSSSNKNYAQMGGYLSYLSNATGTDFTKYKTRDALAGALDAAMNNTKTSWNTLQQQYQGGSSQAMPSRLRQVLQPTQQPAAQPPQFPAGGFGSTGGMNLSQPVQ